MSTLNKKLLIAIGVLVLLLVGLLVALKLSQRPQIIEKEAVEKVASLSLTPSSGTYNKNQQFAVNIFLNTGGKNVVGVDVSLTFDSDKLQAKEVNPGSLFGNQIVFKNEVSGNKILLSLGSFTPYNGSGVYGTIQFLAKAVGTASVNFDSSPNSKVSEEGVGDILGQTSSGSYEITETGLTPSPTPTGETTPTLTPTPTSTLIPTSTLTPTQIPTSTPTSSQVPTSTPTSSPTPSPTPSPGIGGPPEPTATPQPTKTPTSTPKPASTPTTKPGIGGLAQSTFTPTPITQVGMGELTPPTATPTPIQLPSAGFALPSIFVILTGALLIISAIIFI